MGGGSWPVTSVTVSGLTQQSFRIRFLVVASFSWLDVRETEARESM